MEAPYFLSFLLLAYFSLSAVCYFSLFQLLTLCIAFLSFLRLLFSQNMLLSKESQYELIRSYLASIHEVQPNLFSDKRSIHKIKRVLDLTHLLSNQLEEENYDAETILIYRLIRATHKVCYRCLLVRNLNTTHCSDCSQLYRK